MSSLWEMTSDIPGFEPLNRDMKTDVLIIGGGMAGVLCAYMLHNCGIPYVLAEAENVCGGITKNTTAKITSQHGFIYNRIIREFGKESAALYFKANEEALEKYRAVCADIDCDFTDEMSFVYSLDDRKKVEKEIAALEKIGADAEFCNDLPLPFPVAGAVKYKNQAQFHPLKFVSAISKNLNIYEHTRVLKLDGTTAITDTGKIEAKKVIVTTHFPFINKHGAYFLKMYQHRSYVIALKGAPDVSGIYVDEKENGMSFRNYHDLLFVGGGDHRTGKKGGGWNFLRDFARRYYPDSSEEYHWATQDCMTLDGMPYIGEYSPRTPNVYVATGFNKWGMSTSMLAATLLSDIIQGKDNPYASLFSPSRTSLHPKLIVNMWEAAANLILPKTPRCTHLGCALKWNPQEHTWDCPCHGSRFEKDGKLIDNPATRDLDK